MRAHSAHQRPRGSPAGNDEIENQLKRDRVLAKNEIKMLLLGAGESGKVRASLHSPLTGHPQADFPAAAITVDRPQANEAHSPRWLQRSRAGLVQGDHLLQHRPEHARHPRSHAPS